MGHYSNQADPLNILDQVAVAPRATRSRAVKKQMQARLSKAQAEEVAARYAAGESGVGLAAAFGVHRHTIMRALKVHGVVARSRKLSPTDAEAAAALRLQGWTYAQLGERFDVDGSTVRRTLMRIAG